jgi:hypothetical protein
VLPVSELLAAVLPVVLVSLELAPFASPSLEVALDGPSTSSLPRLASSLQWVSKSENKTPAVPCKRPR